MEALEQMQTWMGLSGKTLGMEEIPSGKDQRVRLSIHGGLNVPPKTHAYILNLRTCKCDLTKKISLHI